MGLCLAFLLVLMGCTRLREQKPLMPAESDSLTILKNREAREDSLVMAKALSEQKMIPQIIVADLETEPVKSHIGEDAADDPAIWYNEAHPGKSLVLGTDKTSGIYVYNLEGRIIQYLNAGRINNIDLRDGFTLGGKEYVLVAGSNRSNNCITFFTLDKNSGILSDSIANVKSGVDEVYGLCCYRSPNGFYVYVNGKGGLLEQWKIRDINGLRATLVRSTQLSSQPEGMVADDQAGLIYLGVEQEGIFIMDAHPDGDTKLTKLPGSDQYNPNIVYDIEGLTIFTVSGKKYLLASSQGNFSYALFSLDEEPEYLTSFIISDGDVDGVEETDGLEVVTLPLNQKFSQGLLVVQDGYNTEGFTSKSQNYKYIAFEKIKAFVEE